MPAALLSSLPPTPTQHPPEQGTQWASWDQQPAHTTPAPMDSAHLRPTPDSGARRPAVPCPEHSPRTRSPAQLLPREPAGHQLLSLKSLAPEYKVLGTRSLKAWAAAKAEIRGRGGLQWSNFRPPAALGPEGQQGGWGTQAAGGPSRTPGEKRDSRLLAGTDIKGTEASASRQSGVWSGWS